MNISNSTSLAGNYYSSGWRLGSGRELTSTSPWDGSELWRGQEPTREQVNDAVLNASSAQASWRRLTVDQRHSHLARFVELVKRDAELLATTVARESGKPLWEARTEVGAVQGKLLATTKALDSRASTIALETPIQGVPGVVETLFKPLGVVSVLGPYNFPIHMANGHIIPALLAGNAVIYKPSELGLASSHQYAELLLESGIPEGVFTFLPGTGDVGRWLVEHPTIRGVYFTGSEAVGAKLRSICAASNKRCAVEAGGNCSLYVESYDDEPGALSTVIQSAFWGGGQRCNSARNLLVTSDVLASGFIERLVEKAQALAFSSDFRSETNFFGPMRRSHDVARVGQARDRLRNLGGQELLSGSSIEENDLFLTPTISMMPVGTGLDSEETMGPLLRIYEVKDALSAAHLANQTRLRLIAGIISTSESSYQTFLENADFGGINWNCPTSAASGYASFGGAGESGNYSPAGFLSIDYCVTAQSVMRKDTSRVVG